MYQVRPDFPVDQSNDPICIVGNLRIMRDNNQSTPAYAVGPSVETPAPAPDEEDQQETSGQDEQEKLKQVGPIVDPLHYFEDSFH